MLACGNDMARFSARARGRLGNLGASRSRCFPRDLRGAFQESNVHRTYISSIELGKGQYGNRDCSRARIRIGNETEQTRAQSRMRLLFLGASSVFL